MSVSQLRSVAANRRTIGDTIAATLVPLEQNAHQTAMEANRFIAQILEAHNDARLPPYAGMDIVTTLSEAASLAVQSRVKIGEAHAALLAFSKEGGIVFAGPPECPPEHVLTGA